MCACVIAEARHLAGVYLADYRNIHAYSILNKKKKQINGLLNSTQTLFSGWILDVNRHFAIFGCMCILFLYLHYIQNCIISGRIPNRMDYEQL